MSVCGKCEGVEGSEEAGGARKEATPQSWRVRVCLSSERSSLTPREWASSDCQSLSSGSNCCWLWWLWLARSVGKDGAESGSRGWEGTTSLSSSSSSLSSSSRRESARERASHDILFNFFFFGFREEKVI